MSNEESPYTVFPPESRHSLKIPPPPVFSPFSILRTSPPPPPSSAHASAPPPPLRTGTASLWRPKPSHREEPELRRPSSYIPTLFPPYRPGRTTQLRQRGGGGGGSNTASSSPPPLSILPILWRLK